MTEFAETIAFGGKDIRCACPFPHDVEEKDYTNEFRGDGQKLRTSMRTGRRTSTIEDYGLTIPIEPELDPKERPGHELNAAVNPRPISLGIAGVVLRCSVTCAAHHLIPAQESLRDSDVLPWLINVDKPAEVKKGDSKETVHGYVANNVGYDVNGADNGVWLPGPYAMMGIWTILPDSEEEDVISDSDADLGDKMQHPSVQLRYAVQAMDKAKAQFHDRHDKYSKFVKECLNLVALRMDKAVFPYFEGCCDKCREKMEKSGNEIPPPYSLIARLNDISGRLRARLEGVPLSWKLNIYTSAKALEYMTNARERRSHSEQLTGSET